MKLSDNKYKMQYIQYKLYINLTGVLFWFYNLKLEFIKFY